MKPKCYVFDLDGTLFDNSPRAHLAPSGLPRKTTTDEWTVWNKACHLDKPIDANIAIAQALKEAGYSIGYVTSRCEDGRQETSTTLRRHQLPIGEMTMREVGDNRPASEMKLDVFNEISEYFDIMGAFDDDESVINTLRENGYNMIQVKL